MTELRRITAKDGREIPRGRITVKRPVGTGKTAKKSIVLSSHDRMLVAPAVNTWRDVNSAKRKQRKLSARVHGGIRSHFKNIGKVNKRCSVVTLTVDPMDETPQQCYQRMTKAWNALSTWWRKKYPAMKFFRVVELHKNGFPHFHVMLICAPFIQQKSIVGQWKDLLGQSRAVVDIRAIRGTEHAVRYVTKYLLKQSQVAQECEAEAQEAFKSNIEQAQDWQTAADAARTLGLEDEAQKCEAEAHKILGQGDEVRIACLIADIKRAQDEGRIESAVWLENRLERVKQELQEVREEAQKNVKPESKNIADASWWGRRVRPWSASRGLLEAESGAVDKWWNNVSIVTHITPAQADMMRYSLGFEIHKFDADIGFYDFRANAPNPAQA
jgi:hypothetical protein